MLGALGTIKDVQTRTLTRSRVAILYKILKKWTLIKWEL